MKSKVGFIEALALSLAFILSNSLIAQNSLTDYSGAYETEWGKMVITQSGSSVTGTYEHDNGRLEGTVSGNVITGNWYEEPTSQPPTDAGTFRFEFNSDGSVFDGSWKYGYADAEWSGYWIGRKIPGGSVQIGGEYETEWGSLSLVQNGNSVTGKYSYDEGRLEGTLTGMTLSGKWFETPSFEPPDDAGLFEFVFSDDLKSFTGMWKYGFEPGPLTAGSWSGRKKE